MSTHEEFEKKSIWVHFEELRKTLIYIFIFVGLGFFISLAYTDSILDFLKRPIAPFLNHTSGELVFLAPIDKFFVHMKVAVFSGFVISSPFWIYEVWKFISPALYKKEKMMALSFMSLSVSLFLGGMSFVYFIVYPPAFKFLLGFGGSQDQAFITLTDYMSFLLTTLTVFGLTFQMPLVFVFLNRMGVLSKGLLQKNRRYAFVFMAFLAAFITPPDIMSMVFLLIPLFVLYEVSVLLMKA